MRAHGREILRICRRTMRYGTAVVSPSRRVDELTRRVKRAEIVEVFVPAAGKAHELLGLMGEREQALSEADGNRRIIRAMHDEKRHGNPRDTLVGMELIAHQQANRHDPKQRAGDVYG